ncbi:hypothetical protein HPB47_020478, partial [Ixodes persulcatus]
MLEASGTPTGNDGRTEADCNSDGHAQFSKTVQQLIAECKHYEDLQSGRISNTGFERLPEVSTTTADTDLPNLIRRIIRDELRDFLGSLRLSANSSISQPEVPKIEQSVPNPSFGAAGQPVDPGGPAPAEMAVKAAQRYFGPSRFVTRGSESTPYELLIDQEHERPHRRSMFRKTGVRVGLVLVLLVMVVFCALSPLLFSRHTLPEKRPVLVASASILGNFSSWAVATDASLCAPVARKVQARGGTIADVAVATLLCMGVVLPHSMGMGGGFLATVYT